MRKTSDFIVLMFLLLLVGLSAYFNKEIVNFILDFINGTEIIENTVIEANTYKSYFKYNYINETTSTVPNNKDDLKKIYYSFVNSGMYKINIVCSNEYTNCVSDASDLSNDSIFINIINNFVHPYNSYKYIETTLFTNMISLKSEKNYSEDMIEKINLKVDEILDTYTTPEMTTKEKIKSIHDYIINNTKYDVNRNTISNLAYGPLFYGIGTCGGYTDAMSIFLYKLNLPNYKINTEDHIWNVVYIDGTWYHLDLTWDDPISERRDILSHDYFLITDDELIRKNDPEHNYDRNIFSELKN